MGARAGTRTRTKAGAQRPLRSMRVWDEVTSTVQRLFQEEAVGADSRGAGEMSTLVVLDGRFSFGCGPASGAKIPFTAAAGSTSSFTINVTGPISATAPAGQQ